MDISRNLEKWMTVTLASLQEAEQAVALPDTATPADVYDAYLHLSEAQVADVDGRIQSRGRTCGAIANSMAFAANFNRGNGLKLIPWFKDLRTHWAAQEGGRAAALSDTARREGKILEAILYHGD